MSQYLVLERIQVQNANCIAGFTWGFPAITHFLGFTHVLHRQLVAGYEVSLDGCAVICHEHQAHTYQAKKGQDITFIQSKNPPYLPNHKKDENAPIVEEGHMNITVSLVISLEQALHGDSENKSQFESKVKSLCRKSKLAGGSILDVKAVTLHTSRTDKEKSDICGFISRKLMPGFVLVDRSEALSEYYQSLKTEQTDIQLLDAWLRFSALRYRAKPSCKGGEIPNEKTDAKWELEEKPVPRGWLVPIMSGYKAISPVYSSGEVANVRDETVPACFVEAVHTIGEWRSVHRITDIDTFIWKYQIEGEWYLCKQTSTESSQTNSQVTQPTSGEVKTVSFETALNTL